MKRYTHMPADRRSAGFTLVELLVVIAIIGLLIAIALPGFRGARIAAKKTATQAVIASIEAGLQQYREERALGNTYPPSASDSVRDGDGFTLIKDPVETSGADVRITGASLIVYGLAGADLQGTRGFKRVSGYSTWAESMNAESTSKGLYDPTISPPWPDYGPFVGANALDRVEFLVGLEKFPIGSLDFPLTAQEQVQRVFVDDFGGPILYYRARPAAKRMVTQPGVAIGVYDFRDNMQLTRYEGSRLRTTRYFQQADFGAEGAFDGFILDEKASPRIGPDETDPVAIDRPVNPDDCLLISAGPDLLFGTQDDVVNWTK
jgi:prepilin-type N-terminal cleavage/methylation domain-containing protein